MTRKASKQRASKSNAPPTSKRETVGSRLTIRFSDAEAKKVRAVAKKRGQKVSDLVRSSVREAIIK